MSRYFKHNPAQPGRYLDADEAEALYKGQLKDGYGMRTPVMMRDSRYDSRVTDAHLHRPGFRVGDAGTRNARQKAYDEYQRDLCDAWKGKPDNKLTGFGSGEFRSAQQEGDVCTINGENGYIRNGVCVRDQPERLPVKLDANAHRSRMAQAYDAYDRELSNAWRMR
jgi:hypothetical protein